MTEPREERRRGRRRRERIEGWEARPPEGWEARPPEGNAFMDTVREAYVRWVALDLWREVDDLRTAAGLDPAAAVDEAGSFVERGPYRELWRTRWMGEIRPDLVVGEPAALFAAVERAVRAALEDEDAARRARGDRPLEEDPAYKTFVDGALGRLLAEGAGELGTP